VTAPGVAKRGEEEKVPKTKHRRNGSTRSRDSGGCWGQHQLGCGSCVEVRERRASERAAFRDWQREVAGSRGEGPLGVRSDDDSEAQHAG
jgi:hypothetical protein